MDTPAIYQEWERLVVTYGVIGVNVHDARLVAAMLVHGLTHILTFNTTDFARYYEIKYYKTCRGLVRAIAMYETVTKPMTFEEFLAWNDGSGRDFELIDGFPMPASEPNANHEDLVERLCTYLGTHCQESDLPYVPRQSKQVRLKTEPGEKERSRKADIVVFAKDEWQRMKGNPSSAAAYVPPPGIIEVVSTNWKDDYLTKLAEYEDLGVSEYWIVDYGAYGGIRYIGSPKQPTITIYQLAEDGEYQLGKAFRGQDRVESKLFPDLPLIAEQIFAMSR